MQAGTTPIPFFPDLLWPFALVDWRPFLARETGSHARASPEVVPESP
jgi:hypothetical protein